MTLLDYYEWLTLAPEDFLRHCERTPFQASGPGGQKRNRVYSAIRLTHTPTGLRAEGSKFREAARNLTDAVHKLRIALAIAGANATAASNAESLKSDGDDGHDDSQDDGNDSDLRDSLIQIKPPANYPAFRAKINPDHRDFPATVFYALAVFQATNADLKRAAEHLGVSPSAFARYLKLDKQIQAAANRMRVAAGHPPLN